MTTLPSTPGPTTPTPAATPPADGTGVRLALHAAPDADGTDGVWWPRSRDLQAEAAALVDAFPLDVGRIDRLLYSRPDWSHVPVEGRGLRRIDAARGRVKIGSFPHDDTRRMVLVMSSRDRLVLRVLPPDTDPAEAERLLAARSSG